MTERYTGPKREADRRPASAPNELRAGLVLDDDGGLSRRQVGRAGVSAEAGGNGIGVRCHTGGCGAGVVITELEELIGLPIWKVYEPEVDATDRVSEKRRWWKRKRVIVAGVVALVIATPLITGNGEFFVLNLVGLGIGALLLLRFIRCGVWRFRR